MTLLNYGLTLQQTSNVKIRYSITCLYLTTQSLKIFHTAFFRPDLNFRGVKWTPIKPDAPHLKYLLIDMSYGIVDEPFEKRISFWRDNRIF